MGSCQEPSEISVGEGQGEADKVSDGSSGDANSETLIIKSNSPLSGGMEVGLFLHRSMQPRGSV